MSRPRRGFTLVEILVALAVLGALGMVLHRVLLFSTRSQGRQQRRGQVLDDAQRIVLHLSDALPLAEGVDEPAPGDETERLVFRDGRGLSRSVDLRDGMLRLRGGGDGPAVLLARDVSWIRFRRPATSFLNLSFELGEGSDGRSFSTGVYLRGARRPVVEATAGRGRSPGDGPAARPRDPGRDERIDALLGLLNQVLR